METLLVVLDVVFYSTFIIGLGSILLAKLQAPLLLKYGKTLQDVKTSSKGFSGYLQTLRVPKRCFQHFYFYSTFIAALNLRQSNTVLAILVFLHSIRRLWETLLVNKFGQNSFIHVSHYLVGLWFYSTVNYTVFTYQDGEHSVSLWLRLFSLLMFAMASWDQHQNHCHLAQLRKYTLPTYGLFRVVGSPHYLDEVGIYLALAMYTNSFKMWLCVVWVMVNLTISALETRYWYRRKFPATAPSYAIIPWVL
ncbi:LADA_0D11584g1_1 [Lachancea dasiensis]|uniref:Polyprenal reductase n=1 Tax=Lachancea dasiensis TaxID=1072105 RepID=A0A1G4J7U2_9SACH|nr:LADA_0D11584g1_1 [Lachancea dasiensis]